MRIAFLDNLNKIGGSQIDFLEILSTLNRLGYQTWSNLPNENGLLPLLQETGTKFIPYHIPEIRKNPLNLSRLLLIGFKIAQFLKGKRIDLLCTNSVPAQILGVIIRKLAGIKVVWLIHDYFGTEVIMRFLVKGADKIIANSYFVRSYIISRCKVAPCKVAVVYNFFDPEKVKAIEGISDQEALPGQGTIRVGIFARLVPWKGIDIFIRCASQVLKTIEDVEFFIVGGGSNEFENYLKQLSSSLGISDKVHFLGYVSPKQAIRIMSQMDVVVNTSANPEPFGRSLVEAGLLEKPVVAFNEGGPREIVVDGLTGFLVPKGDIEAFSNAIVTLLKDRELRLTLGHEAKRFVSEKFSLQQAIFQFEEVLKEIKHENSHA
ncbi:MAG: hypothetical protein DRG83_02685 [Deltaproteobacteria bacterium]|nr:MAG: hypothetical protein DRG83_02685 [Deltaproteobacteria bacterium]